MMSIASAERFDTTMGTVFVVDANIKCVVGDIIRIVNEEYLIKSIIFPTRPADKDKISLLVEKV